MASAELQQQSKKRPVNQEETTCSSMAGSRPMTPASPKILKTKAQEPGIPLFGCGHLRKFMTLSQESTTNAIYHYKTILRVVLDKARVIPQTATVQNTLYITSLTPNYVCLQCPEIFTAKDRPGHGHVKGHQFFVNSRSGVLFCQLCKDFIWDPTMEELRLRKVGSGTLSTRKRKYSELFPDDIKNISPNTIEVLCHNTGLRGIYNMGSTCFMSVILQSFVHNPLLRNFYLSDGHGTVGCLQDECLSCGMGELFQEFYNQDTTTGYIAADILATSWSSQQSRFKNLSGDDEKDAHEFFQFLAEVLHETAQIRRQGLVDDNSIYEFDKKEDCKCIIHQTFYGQIQQSMTCHHCHDIRSTLQPFLDLNLGLEGRRNENGSNGKYAPQTLTLQGCLNEEYTDAEQIDQYKCNTCGDGLRGAKVQRSIKRLPNVLCIQFKRFEHHKEAKTSSKIGTKVQFPLHISMFPYTSRARSQDTKDNHELSRSCTYDLLSVVVHQGDLSSGHYTSYSRVGSQWFLFDDHKVTLASESQVLGAEAFILFYIVRSIA